MKMSSAWDQSFRAIITSFPPFSLEERKLKLITKPAIHYSVSPVEPTVSFAAVLPLRQNLVQSRAGCTSYGCHVFSSLLPLVFWSFMTFTFEKKMRPRF